MAAEHETFTDVVGIPLPFAPRNDLPAVGQAQSIEANWHHHFHPRKSKLLEGIGGQAVRNVRLQWADFVDHSYRYHQYFLGPKLPETDDERFKICVLSSAGYVPEQAIDLSANKPQKVSLTQEQRSRLWQSGELRNAAPEIVRKFLIAHTMKYTGVLPSLYESNVDEFLNTSDEERRKSLGYWLLARAAEIATDPLNSTYTMARRNGLITMRSPSKPLVVVQKKFGSSHRKAVLLNDLREELNKAA